MRLNAWKFVFCLTVVFLFSSANASIAKRASDSSGSGSSSSGSSSGSGSSSSGSGSSSTSNLMTLVTKIDTLLQAFPIVGSYGSRALEWTIQFISLFEVGTNGALARLLGGALPCTISLLGTECSGLDSNGGFGKLLMDVVNGVPSLLLPSFIKSLLGLGIQLLIDPTIDVLFGGVVVSS